MKKSNPNPNANRNILRLAYVVAGVFVCMLLYLGYFLQFESGSVINNAYNPRVDLLAERVVRGELLSSDGQVLARTVTAEDGSERREYPFGSLFAHVVGYTGNGKTGIESLTNFYLLTSHVNLVEQVFNARWWCSTTRQTRSWPWSPNQTTTPMPSPKTGRP